MRGDIDNVPVIILSRDRLSCLHNLVTWLENAGLHNIVIVDMNSSYGPLVEYLRTSPYRVLRLHENAGPRAIWDTGEVQDIIRERHYVVTDPDIVPDPACPVDFLPRFYEILQRHRGYSKVGFGLRLDDIPDTYKHKNAVLKWEKQFWKREIEPGVYEAPIDTTFALYRPGSGFSLQALRTGFPYLARHLPWYLDLAALPEDEKYYLAHADSSFGNWRHDLSTEIRVYLIRNPVMKFMRKRARRIKRTLAKRDFRVKIPTSFTR